MAQLSLNNRINSFLLLLFLSIGAMYIAGSFLKPITFAGLVAMLLLPIARLLENKLRFKRMLSSLVCVFSFAGIIFLLVWAFTLQLGSFRKDLPQLRVQFYEKIGVLQHIVESNTGINSEEQAELFKEKSAALIQLAEGYVSKLAAATSHIALDFTLFFLYLLFFLLYRNKIKGFVLLLLGKPHEEEGKLVMSKISKVTQQYLLGKMIVMLIAAILNSIGLLIVGVEHAIFFGVLAAFLGIIPYVGTFVGVSLPFMMAFVTSPTLSPALAVVATLFGIHFLESNILIPAIIGEKVNLNALVAILAVIIGGLIWGIAGMVLFLPLAGIFKIICDHTPQLRAFGYLLGNEDDIEKPLEDTIPVKG
jgi:predicted PurR-regulated permease PerM